MTISGLFFDREITSRTVPMVSLGASKVRSTTEAVSMTFWNAVLRINSLLMRTSCSFFQPRCWYEPFLNAMTTVRGDLVSRRVSR